MEDASMETMAARIRRARVDRGLSQTELANALGVNRSTVGHWEREQGFDPSIEHVQIMSQIMNVSVDWLLSGSCALREVAPSGGRAGLETRLLELSKHLPASFLIKIVALMESAESYM